MTTWKIPECRAVGLLPLEEESDVLTSGNEPTGGEEEPDAYEELEEMKQRLILLRSKILRPELSRCQDVDDQKDLTTRTPERQQLELLRRQKYLLQCRLKEAKMHLEETSREVKELEDWRCLLQSRILEIKRKLSQFVEFMPRVKHHFGLCIERWEYLKSNKIDSTTYRQKMQAQALHADNSRKCVVPMSCHKNTRQHLRMELMMLRVFLHNLFEAMVSDFRFFCRQMNINFTRLPSIDTTPTNSAGTPTNSVASFEVEVRE
ncbi:uncharacterized protein LOC108147341 [Drosophila elegans]|uniref:uncharacterized protein LOC108147341 n=1 Tax=Drosophila elegans TaxID=30023 RepID=UPI0007E707A5|nr:uncharacterized protein LOC108147341 [Drosophila elegans]